MTRIKGNILILVVIIIILFSFGFIFLMTKNMINDNTLNNNSEQENIKKTTNDTNIENNTKIELEDELEGAANYYTEEGILIEKKAKSIVKSVLKKYYNELLPGSNYTYCQKSQIDYNKKEKLKYVDENNNIYLPSDDFKSKQELENYLSKYLSNNMIKKIVDDKKYIEKNNKLYCLYKSKEYSKYSINTIKNSITEATKEYYIGEVEVKHRFEPTAETVLNEVINVRYKFIKENDTWLLDEIEEKE